MSGKIKLTEKYMGEITLPTEGEVRIVDKEVPQLIVRVRAGGKPRWYLSVRAGKRLRQIPLGELNSWPAVPVVVARELARTALVTLAKNSDPVADRKQARAKAKEERQGGKVPLSDVVERHAKQMRERNRSPLHVREVERIGGDAIKAGVVDLAQPRIAVVAQRFLDGLDVSPSTRLRYRRHLCALGKTALKAFPADVLPRDPFLALGGEGAPLPMPPMFTPWECCRLVSDAALANDDNAGPLWAFLLYTGCRCREATWA